MVGTVINTVLFGVAVLAPAVGMDMVPEPMANALVAATVPIAAAEAIIVFNEVNRCGSLKGSTVAALLLTVPNFVAIGVTALTPSIAR